MRTQNSRSAVAGIFLIGCTIGGAVPTLAFVQVGTTQSSSMSGPSAVPTIATLQQGQGPRRLALPVPASAAETAELLGHFPDLRRFLSEEGKGWDVTFDRRSGEPMLLQGPGIPLLPGDAEPRARGLLAKHPRMFGDVAAGALLLDAFATGSPDGANELYLIRFRHAPWGYDERDARVTFVVNHGKLIQIHADRMVASLGAVAPLLTVDEAWARMLVTAGVTEAPKLLATELQTVLLSPGDEPPGVYTGPIGLGYERHLAHVFRFQLPDDPRTLVAYVDARSADLLELFDDNRYAGVTGAIFPRTSGTTEVVAPFVDATVQNVGSKTTDLGGNYSYALGVATSTLSGANVLASDSCGAANVSTATAPGNLLFGPSSSTDCSFSSTGHATRAARNAFYHLNNVRRMGQKWLQGVNAIATAWFGSNVPAHVNVMDMCNAFWDGSSVNMFRSGGGCNNTGEISDVFFHEWGHGLDQNTKSTSVGDSAKGEAVGDTVALLMTHDQCIAPNFFATTGSSETIQCPTASRDLAFVITPQNISRTCSTSTTCHGALGYECHCESHVLSGAHWRLAQLFVQRYGVYEGWNRFEKGFLRALPSITAYLPMTAGNAYDAWLAADDDNGNVTTGTPNADIIFQAFYEQGIAGTHRNREVVQCATPPGAPTVSATGNAGNIALSWSAVSGATSYSIFRNQTGNEGQAFLPLASGLTGTTYTDTQVQGGYPYAYEVVAIVGGCASPYGTPATATATPVVTLPGPKEASPQNDMTAARSAGLVDVTYTPACFSSDHTVYAGDLDTLRTAGLSWSQRYCFLQDTGSLSFALPAGNTYFVVVGNDGVNEGSYGRTSTGERPAAGGGPGGCGYTQILSGVCP